ncbi:serine/threonine-protein kinase Nek2-like [Acanthaster planci]|uniref:non-specific serine/threonine protein kinase n=1 Tax=Acanthaster planci TaxID=133434 RepID=A0A8B7YQW3_ACAPL|nr:serine/threonine-protein kinase Nek2-like [Acanthaster planci]
MPSKLSDYEVICTIGIGSYGKCKRIKRKSDSKILAWKEINYGSMSETEKQMLVSEVNLLRGLRHEFIVRYYDRIVDRNTTTIYIIMEYCEGGDLGSLITRCKRERKYLEEDFAWKVLRQITLALNECQQRVKGRAVLHRDLKPANVFLDAAHNVKLGDFGLARVLHHDTSFAKTFVGTPYYMSPELMDHCSYNEKSDMWSLGCLIYELCSLSPPFTAINQQHLAVKIKEGKFRPLPSQYSPELQDLISRMLKVDAVARPSIEDILKLPKILQLSNQKKDRRSSQPEDATASGFQERLDNVARREETLKRKEEAMQRREDGIRLRERQLEERTRLLETKEKCMATREKLAEEKLQRAETLLSQYQATRLQLNERVKELQTEKDCQEDVHPAYIGTTPKRVHFAPLAPGKENEPPRKPTDPSLVSEKHPEGKAAQLKERLYKAKLRSLALQKEEQTAKYKSKLLMNMMR